MKNDSEKVIASLLDGKEVLFASTREQEYIRNSQEINIIVMHAKRSDIVCSNNRCVLIRTIEVLLRIFLYTLRYKYDVIFVGFAPQLIIPFHIKRKRCTLIVDFFISVYDTLVFDRKVFKQGTILARFCHKIDEITYNRADFVIADTYADLNYFVSEFAKLEKTSLVLYLSADSTIYYPRKQKKDANEINKYVVLYFGSILPLQGVDIVIEAINKLKDREDILFKIIGPINVIDMNVVQNNVVMIDWLPQIELSNQIANADLCLAGHFSGIIDKANRTVPGKAYIYEMMKKEMVLGDSVANHEVFCDDDLHHYVTMGNSDSLANMIERLADRTATYDE